MIKAINTACVMVSSKVKAKEWYTKTLGMVVKADMEHWVVVGFPDAAVGLHLCETEFPGSALEPGNSGILLGVDDLAKTVAELKAKGARIAQDITVEEWGTYALVADPDGNEFWLMAD